MSASLDKFTRQVVDSGLMSADEVRAAVAGAGTGAKPEDGKQLARFLVRHKRLTAFQAQQIYSGKGASLVLGNYVVLDKLGQGGMGLVFKAEHRRMKRLVALKVLSPAVTKDPEATRRFQREVEAAAKLEHPHIVTAFDADEAGGTHFLVMQYVEGTDLAALVRSRGTLPVDKAVACVLQAARGLDYAHARGVIHRDIKPSNLLLEEDGTVKILDMGLARLDSADVEQATEDQLTGTGQIMGTVDYMAPEQALDTHTADARADLYSLGCTLWYLLTGRAVYGGDTVVKKLMAHQNSPPPSLREACGPVSPELDAVFTRMIAKNPEARYQSMSELIADLQRCTGGTAAAPTLVAVPGEDSRFSEFLRGLDSSVPAVTVARTATKKPGAKTRSAAATGVAQTVTIRSADVESDPQTQRTLISPLAAPLVEPEIDRPRRQAGRAWWRNRGVQIGAAAAGLVLLLGALVLFVQTEEGTIRVEINDPAIEVAIKGTDIVLKQADKGKDVTLSPGDKTLVVQRGDFQFETDKLILKDGELVTVRVDLLAGDIEVRQGEKLLGRRALPSGGHEPHDGAGPTLDGDRGAAVASLPEQMGGLEFDGADDKVQIPSLAHDGPEVTIEARVLFRGETTGARTIVGGALGEHFLSLWGHAPLAGFSVFGQSKDRVAKCHWQSFDPDVPHDLAGVYDGEHVRFFMDGRLIATDSAVAAVEDVEPVSGFAIGGHVIDRPTVFNFKGVIDDVRISRIARYDADYQVPARLEADGHTLGLYRFDEGSGEVLKDSSGNGHDGRILGARWVRKSEPGDSSPRDRAAAEWVLSMGGDVQIRQDGKMVFVNAGGTLPAGEWELVRVVLVTRKIPEAEFEPLKNCTALEYLNLSGTPMTPVGLACFKDCGNLTFLELSNTRLTDEGAACFKNCKNLTYLNLGANPISDAGLAHFQDCRNLTQLFLHSTAITDAGLAHLQQCDQLTYLNLGGTAISDGGLARFQDCRNLADLYLHDTAITDAGLAHFQDCRKLTHLDVHHTRISDAGLAPFQDCHDLTHLDLRSNEIGDQGLGHFRDCNNLTFLRLSFNPISDAGLLHFQDCPNLTQLYLAFTQISDAGLACFQDCENLTHLVLAGARISDAGLAHFQDCRDLTTLSLYGTPISDAGLAHFRDCNNLADLNLGDIPISDVGLAHFRDCNNLTVLRLNNTRISNAGLTHFQDCTNLTELWLDGTQISNDGLACLAGMAKLKDLKLQGAPVTAEGVAALHKIIPRCRIEWDGGVIEPLAAADLDRAAAEWVLSIGGMVRVNGEERDVKQADALPSDGAPCKLTWVHLAHNAQATDAGLAALRDCDSLRYLRLSFTAVSDAGLAHFQDCDKLTTLYLAYTPVSDAGLAHFRNCRELTYLNLGNTATGDGGLAHFQHCHNLTDLLLYDTRISDAGLAHLRDCNNLTDLNLSNTAIGDTGLAYLQDCHEMQVLHLEGTAITDAGLAGLPECRHMTELHLNRTSISDAGLAFLAGLTKLTNLHLNETQVTAQGVEALHKKIPQCRIESDFGTFDPPAPLSKGTSAAATIRQGAGTPPSPRSRFWMPAPRLRGGRLCAGMTCAVIPAPSPSFARFVIPAQAGIQRART